MSRKKPHALTLFPAFAAIVALTFTGCSSGGKDTTAAEEGPLSKYLSALWDGEEWTQEKYDEQNKQTEELVAVCMQNEGFEYIPDLQSGGVFMTEDEDGPQWGTEEFAKEFGYGMSTDPWAGQDTESREGGEYVDPNQEYVDSLSESEQQAYYETLHGVGMTEEEMVEAEENGGSWEYDWTTAGCYGAAQHEVEQEQQGAMAAYEDPEFADLFEAIDTMYAEVWGEAGPTNDELVQLDAQWADCMADKGYEYTSPTDANQQLNDELNEIYNLGYPDESEENWEEPSEGEWATIQANIDAEIKKFQPYEIEVATADFACKKKLDYDTVSQKVMFDLEQKFVDSHKSELDALLAKYATTSKKQ